MALADFANKTYLVVDDFSDMRAVMRSMLFALGATQVDQARDGADAILQMTQKHYDVVLCDYNLGPGKDGQQVLEEVRRRDLIGVDTIFAMVTAENARDMVMGAVEYVPDSYLTKPLTKEVLNARLLKLFERKADLAVVNQALNERDYTGAINELNRLIASRPRNLAELLHLKADLCLNANRLDEAMEVYEKVLGMRELNWAHLGKGRVLFKRQKYDAAREIFTHLLELDPHYIPAYDWLARTQVAEQKSSEAQGTLERAVKFSPRYVERQHRLGELAFDNGDVQAAEAAFTQAVTLAKRSVLNHPVLHVGLAKAKSANGKHVEALKVVSGMRRVFSDDPHVAVYQASATASIRENQGDTEGAAQALHEADELLAKNPDLPAELTLEMARTCAQLGDTQRASAFLQQAVSNNHDDHELLAEVKRIAHDNGLAQEADESIRGIQREIVKTNNAGVQLIRKGQYDEAVALLHQAAEEMTGNKTINLNAAKALLIKMENQGTTVDDVQQLRTYIGRIEKAAPNDWRLVDVKTRLQQLALKIRG